MKRIPQRAWLAAAVAVMACAPRSAPIDGTADAQHHPGAAAERAAAEHDHAAAAHDHAAAHADDHTLPATDGPGFTAADVRFMQHMIGHHAQALTMAVMAPTHGAGEQVLRLAEKIDISQRDEIAMMQRWLAERDQAVPDTAYMHAMQMPGMLTPAQLAQLDAARGAEFDRLFLTLMIQHHEGALLMVDALFASPGAAQDSDIFRFATDVETDQRDEIDVMMFMLELLAANRGSEHR